MVDFRGERRTNDTHESTTDDEAKLSYGAHALMENRNGLCVDLHVGSAIQTETEAAKQMLARQARKRVRPTTLGGDKGYHSKDFVAHLRKKNIASRKWVFCIRLLGLLHPPRPSSLAPLP